MELTTHEKLKLVEEAAVREGMAKIATGSSMPYVLSTVFLRGLAFAMDELRAESQGPKKVEA